MTNEQLRLLNRFEIKLKEKLLLCEALNDECELLRSLLIQKIEENTQLSESHRILQEKYKNLKIAAGLSATVEDSSAKKEFAAIVQEIDKCIQLLNA